MCSAASTSRRAAQGVSWTNLREACERCEAQLVATVLCSTGSNLPHQRTTSIKELETSGSACRARSSMFLSKPGDYLAVLGAFQTVSAQENMSACNMTVDLFHNESPSNALSAVPSERGEHAQRANMKPTPTQ